MKFYGHGIVWDKANNKSLCAFKDGELETEDERAQNILIELGYACDPVKEVERDEPSEISATDGANISKSSKSSNNK